VTEKRQARLDPDVDELLGMMARLVRRLRRADEGIPPELEPIIVPAGLGLRHLTPLILIATYGPLPVGELARHLALNPATTSQLVNELARGGLVARQEDDADRRRTLLTVHPDHRKTVVALVERQLQPVRTALAELTDLQRKHFMHGWRLLINAMEDRPETASKPPRRADVTP